MERDVIMVQTTQADAIQAEAELKRMDAEARKDDAKKRIDDELGLSTKRSEFKARLEKLRKSAKDDFNKLMAQYKSDWDGFKADVSRRYKKADRVGTAQADLLSARIDGLSARVQYLVGLQVQDNAAEAKAIQKSLEPVLEDFRALGDEIRRAFQRSESAIESDLANVDRQIQDDGRKSKSKAKARPEAEQEEQH